MALIICLALPSNSKRKGGQRQTSCYLGELREEAWHVRLVLPGLTKHGGKHGGGEEVGDRVVEVSMLRQPASALEQRQESRPCAKEEEGHQHQRYGAASVLDDQHLAGRQPRQRQRPLSWTSDFRPDLASASSQAAC